MQSLAGQPALQSYTEGLLEGFGYDETRRPESFCAKASSECKVESKDESRNEGTYVLA